jgi:hypothetical protein
MRGAILLLWVAGLVAAGCGDPVRSPAGPPPDAGGAGTADGPITRDGPRAPDAGPPDAPLDPRRFGVTTTIGFDPADAWSNERHICKYVTLQNDRALDVVRIRSKVMGAKHHFNVYVMLTPRANPPHGANDCYPGAEQSLGKAALLLSSVKDEEEFVLPEGIAFSFYPYQQFVLELHTINPSGEAVPTGATFDMTEPGTDNPIRHHAAVHWFANWDIFIPGGAEVTRTGVCPVPYAMRVFALVSHQHGLGTGFSIDAVRGGVDTRMYESPDWAHPKLQLFDPPFDLEAMDGLKWTCSWQNPDVRSVEAGINASDEMCVAYALAYPRDSLDAPPVFCEVGTLPLRPAPGRATAAR